MTHRFNSDINVTGVTNCLLIRFTVCCTGGNSYLLLQIWPRTHDWGAHRHWGWSYYYYLINGNNIKLPSKCIFSLIQLYFVSLRFLSECCSVHHVSAVPVEARRGLGFSGSGYRFLSLCVCWELIPGPSNKRNVKRACVSGVLRHKRGVCVVLS